MKKVILLVMILALVLSTGMTPVMAEETDEKTSVTEEETEEISRIVHSYSKTISLYFYDFGNIPLTYYYQEYDETTGTWFRGTLELQSVVREYSNGRVVWKSTYSGTITGNI